MNRKRIPIAAALLTAALLLDSRYNVQESEYELGFPSLPESFDGCRIVLLSDLHGRYFGRDNSRLAKKLRELSPDIIAVTGDMASSEEELEAFDDLLSGIEGLAPIYYVNGNHEWGAKITTEARAIVENHGGTCLSNQYVKLGRYGEHIVICGAEDRNGPEDMTKPPALAQRLREEYPEDFVLWLYHRNDSLERYPLLPVDLILSGHAHGGIVRLPFAGGLLNVKGRFGAEYENGIYREIGPTLLVSRGLGNSIFIPRFLNRPDIPVITLRRT